MWDFTLKKNDAVIENSSGIYTIEVLDVVKEETLSGDYYQIAIVGINIEYLDGTVRYFRNTTYQPSLVEYPEYFLHINDNWLRFYCDLLENEGFSVSRFGRDIHAEISISVPDSKYIEKIFWKGGIPESYYLYIKIVTSYKPYTFESSFRLRG